MKRTWFWLLVPILVVYGTSSIAFAQAETSPATQQSGFLCEINLDELLPGSGTLTTFDTTRLCTGSLANENIKLTCLGSTTDAALFGQSSNDFECTIATDPCDVAGVPSTVLATSESMSVDSEGNVSMICFYK